MQRTQYSIGAVKALCGELDGIKRAILANQSGGNVSAEMILRIENLEAAVVGINEKMAKIAAKVLGEGDKTPEADTLPEIISLLAGFTNDQRLKQEMAGELDENGIIHY